MIALAGFVVIMGLMVAFLALTAVYYGWALTVLWGWFAVPMGLPAITIAQAIGLNLLIGMFKKIETDAKGEKEWANKLADLFLKPIIVLGLGYIVTLFM